jgi:predicted site-specific integrase-resolvase
MPRLKRDAKLLGSCQAAEFLGVTRSTLASWRRRGEIKPTTVEDGPLGPRYKFSTLDLETFRERIDYDA